ncbi:MAG TPA: hypothetical protein VES42_17105 [Pilimelia sp.]|nr:hypothetical protein [Pilimelia sp.]
MTVETVGPGESGRGGGSAAAGPASDAAPDAGDGRAQELADKLRLLAAVDPALARELVTDLVASLNRATGGAFGTHLSPAARGALGLALDLDGDPGRPGRPAAMTVVNVDGG